MMPRYRLRWLCIALAVWSAAAWGQEIQFELGIAGQPVTGTWNPLRLRMRDQPRSTLRIDIQYGGLHETPRQLRYEAALEGGQGLYEFRDELYLPDWRSLSWQVRSDERVLASGGLDAREADDRALHLILSRQPGRLRARLPDEARAIDVLPGELPERMAAYSGVDSVIIDGSLSAPSSRALAAAASAGVRVVFIEPLASSHAQLASLLPERAQRLAAGWLLRAEEDNLGEVLSRHGATNRRLLPEALRGGDLESRPSAIAVLYLGSAAAGYGLVVLVLIGVAKVPGLLAALALSALLSLSAWLTLRPHQEQETRARSVQLAAEGLAYTLELRTHLTWPEHQLELPASSYPLNGRDWQLGPGQTTVAMPRWSTLTLALRPRLEDAPLRWQEGHLVNASSQSWSDVYVIGLGRQATLTPEARLNPRQRSGDPPERYLELIELLPEGSALARRGGEIVVVLPADTDLSAAGRVP